MSGSTVTIVAAGSTTLTATQAASGNYSSGSQTATLTVNTIAPTITFNNINKFNGNSPFALSPTSNSSGSFSYTSSNTAVATVSGSTVTIVGVGSTTLTATQAASGNYSSGSQTATLTVAINVCAITAPCLNGGSCTNVWGGGYTCSCSSPYSGTDCELDDTNCNADSGAPCLNGGTCTPTPAHGECSCPVLFMGSQCELFDNSQA